MEIEDGQAQPLLQPSGGAQQMTPEQAFLIEQQLAYAMFERQNLARQSSSGLLPQYQDSNAAAMNMAGGLQGANQAYP